MNRTARFSAALAAVLLAAAAASGAGEAVGVWRTTADLSAKLSQQAGLTFGTDSGTAPFTIAVDPTVRYQQMDGFGVSLTDSASSLIMNQLSSAKRTEAGIIPLGFPLSVRIAAFVQAVDH